MATTTDAAAQTSGSREEIFRVNTTPADAYRCPVSTPANNTGRSENTTGLQLKMAPVRDGIVSSVRLSNRTCSRSRMRESKGPVRRSVEYYFVDKHFQHKEEAETNSYWLKSLCAQPVEEILGKYRRKSEFERTRLIWSKTFSTPGERAILRAWETNTSMVPIRGSSASNISSTSNRHLSFSNDVKLSNERSENSASYKRDETRVFLTEEPLLPPRYIREMTNEFDLRMQQTRTIPASAPLQMTRSWVKPCGTTPCPNIWLENTEKLPSLRSSRNRRKGNLILQQRKYFKSGCERPAIPIVKKLVPSDAADTAEGPDVLCLMPTSMLRNTQGSPDDSGERNLTEKSELKLPQINGT